MDSKKKDCTKKSSKKKRSLRLNMPVSLFKYMHMLCNFIAWLSVVIYAWVLRRWLGRACVMVLNVQNVLIAWSKPHIYRTDAFLEPRMVYLERLDNKLLHLFNLF